MPSRPPSTSSPSPPPSPGPGAHAPAGTAMPSGAAGNNNATAGCLPADQSCFALSSHRDAAARACCTATSYLVVLGISFGSLLAILIVLCAIRWYLVRRSATRDAAEAAAAAAAAGTGGADDKKRSAGLDADAIAALPEFVVCASNEDEEERECSVCLGAMAEGEAARRLPRCAHVFHRGCVDVWLREHSTCPVCRAEVVVSAPPGEGCAEKEPAAAEGGGASRASTSTARPPAPHDGSSSADDEGERDLEAQL
ncbi:hypothetical protein PR202_ga11557 [Eleusine coracana subsp. coracana]|uniref:RING-type E3 ubiquitin transferase n=1 Tax=Eleusine coracana subsp. coracana TaxID=191504 RepID=A0AAV5C9B0_ELECO|nr:hypothetical protein QOZ80_5AG0401660 [Eleusine coracana subsp. coracana]GJM94874.1 hypothetical protein PR202_ga11557 [Eleusine coracana subsp. coracana]